MTFFVQHWTTPKSGNRPDQNEDALRICAYDPESLRIALADGASEAIFSGRWAQALVDAAGSDWPLLSDPELSARLDQVRETFAPLVPGAPVPWYIHNKFRAQGSQATLLTATLSPGEESGTWTVRAIALGDCCLLLFDEEGTVTIFPVASSEDFGLNPVLIRSRPDPPLSFTRYAVEIPTGAFLVACSDALAHWMLECLETRQPERLFALFVELVSHPTMAPDLNFLDALDFDLLPDKTDGGIETTDPTETEADTERTPDTDGMARDKASAPVTTVFQRFVEEQRAAESQPCLRDDDTTLILCIPVSNTGDTGLAEAMQVLSRHQGVAQERPPAARPAIETSPIKSTTINAAGG